MLRRFSSLPRTEYHRYSRLADVAWEQTDWEYRSRKALREQRHSVSDPQLDSFCHCPSQALSTGSVSVPTTPAAGTEPRNSAKSPRPAVPTPVQESDRPSFRLFLPHEYVPTVVPGDLIRRLLTESLHLCETVFSLAPGPSPAWPPVTPGAQRILLVKCMVLSDDLPLPETGELPEDEASIFLPAVFTPKMAGAAIESGFWRRFELYAAARILSAWIDNGLVTDTTGWKELRLPTPLAVPCPCQT